MPKKKDAHWIEHSGMKKGALRKELHTKKGEKIPEKKLEKAEHSKNKTLAKRATMAKTLRGLRK